jgi:imidazolonepropionase-like amidohydrolase
MVMPCYWRVAAVAFLGITAFLEREAAHAQSRVSNDFVITHVRVFDGARTLQDTHVSVTGGVIRAVGGDLVPWQRLPEVDGTGLTLVPGLIDAHTHVREAEELRQALRFGVTTMLDMGATEVLPPQQLFALRAAANVTTDMSDLRAAGYMAPPSGASLPTPAIATVGTKQFVEMRRAEGSDYLKILLAGVRSMTIGVRNLDEPTVRALVETAHANGMLAIAHVETLDDVGIALSAGIDGLAHVWRRGGANAEVAGRIAKLGVFVSATLAIPDGYLPDGRASLLADPRFLSVLSNSLKEHLSRSFTPRTAGTLGADELRALFNAHVDGVRSLHEAGARLLIGTDASRNTPAAHGISVHREMELFRTAGLSPSEILTAATASAAEAFRLADRGRILPGRRADLLLVRGDPTSDLLAIRDIVRVWKSGVEANRTVTDR